METLLYFGHHIHNSKSDGLAHFLIGMAGALVILCLVLGYKYFSAKHKPNGGEDQE